MTPFGAVDGWDAGYPSGRCGPDFLSMDCHCHSVQTERSKLSPRGSIRRIPWGSDSRKQPRPMSGGALEAGSVGVGLPAAGPDEREALAVLVVEEVGVDRSVEARIVQLDREVVAAFAGTLGPGGADLGSADKGAVGRGVLAAAARFGNEADVLGLEGERGDFADEAVLSLGEGADVSHDSSPCSLFPSRDHRGLDGDRQAGDDQRCIRLGTEAQRRMPGGRLSCLARNGGAADRGRKSNDGIAAGDRGVAGVRPDQAINETEWCALFGTEKFKENGEYHHPATADPGNWQTARSSPADFVRKPKRPARIAAARHLCRTNTRRRLQTSRGPHSSFTFIKRHIQLERRSGRNSQTLRTPHQSHRVAAARLRQRRSSGRTRHIGRERCKPHPGRGANGDRADHSEDLPPDIGRHREPSETVTSMITSERCGHSKHQGDRDARYGRANEREDKLSDGKGDCARDQTKDDHAERTCPRLIGVHARGHADEERQRIDREREQHPAENAKADDVEKNADDQHGDDSRENRFRGYAFHHYHGAAGSVAENGWRRQWKIGQDLRA